MTPAESKFIIDAVLAQLSSGMPFDYDLEHGERYVKNAFQVLRALRHAGIQLPGEGD